MTRTDSVKDHLPDSLKQAARTSRRTLGRVFLSDKRFIERRYAKEFGRPLNLDHPLTFNEKVNWRKLNDRNPLYEIAANKLAARDYVAERVGPEYLVPVLGVFDSPEEVPWANLPRPCVVKATHGSGWNIFITDSEVRDAARWASELRRWIRTNYFYTVREWAYKRVPPRIIAVSFLGNAPEVPVDYKFFCFHGVPRLIQVDYSRFSRHTRTFYDTSWTALPFTAKYPRGPITPAPTLLPEMTQVATELSRDFDFVRVDLYAVDGKVYFGELTIYPGGGIEPFVPDEWDGWLGGFWNLPEDGSPTPGSRPVVRQKEAKWSLTGELLGKPFDWKQFERRRAVAVARPRVKSMLTPHRVSNYVRDDSDELGAAPPLLAAWPEMTTRLVVGLAQDTDVYPYWTKFRRFLESNGFPCRLVDIHGRYWLRELEGVDLLVWRPSSEPSRLEEARRKIFYLNEFLGMKTYPSLRAVTLYEDKLLQSWAFGALGVATPRTVTSFSLPDALEGVKELGEKVVWKITTGSGSFGVELLSARRAQAAVRDAFSVRGRRTYWPYLNQKGYVYAQEFQHSLRTDLRVIVVGPLLFGYYRDAPPNDFRASGMGRERLEDIPVDALEQAWRMAEALDVEIVGLDFLVDGDCQTRLATEFSNFIRVDTPEQLVVHGRAGTYVRRSAGQFDFHEGRYWLQELALVKVLGQACGLNGDRLLLESVNAECTPLLSGAEQGGDRV